MISRVCSALSIPLLVVLSSYPAAAQANSTCFESSSSVRGRVPALAAGDGLLGIVSSHTCMASVESSGVFILRTLPGPQVITGQGATVCIMPIEVEVPTDGELAVTLRAVLTKSPLDDTTLLLPGAGYLPATYEDRQCRTALRYVREHPGLTTLENAPRLASPDSVIALVLRSDTLSALLGDDRPVRFAYWNEPTATRSGTVDGKPYLVEASAEFIIVEASTPAFVEVRIGSAEPWPGNSALWRIDLRSGGLTLLETFDPPRGSTPLH